MLGTSPGYPTGQNLAAIGNEPPQAVGILVVRHQILGAELAYFLLEEWSASAIGPGIAPAALLSLVLTMLLSLLLRIAGCPGISLTASLFV
jgi:hypothetical protein